MKLNPDEIARFDEQGYLFFPSRFPPAEAALLRAAADEVYALDREEVWRESSGVARTAFAAHTYHEAFRRLGRHPRLIEPVMQLVDGPVYMHQYKVNAEGRVRRRGVAVAPGLRHLAPRRRDAGAEGDEHRGVPRRGDCGQRAAAVSAGKPQAGGVRGRARPRDDQLPALDARPRHGDEARRAGRVRGADRPRRQHHRLRLHPRACEPAEHQSARPEHRLSRCVTSTTTSAGSSARRGSPTATSRRSSRWRNDCLAELARSGAAA